MNKELMEKAYELARRGMGFTYPNPCVGAIIVKGEKVVAEGCHRKAGSDHAEIEAMKKLMKKSGIVTVDFDPSLCRNAELYVTLEPCSHNGKTPSCARAIAAAGFSKVNIGMRDPSKKVNGKGISIIKKSGIKVEILKSGTPLSDKIRGLNQQFIKWEKTCVPYVVLKAGMSMDGKIATSKGQSKWITSEKARYDARIERSKCDAVMVGAGTVIADDPELSTEGKYDKKMLLRVIIDPKLKTQLSSKVYRDENVIVLCNKNVSKKNLNKFKKAGIRVKKFNQERIPALKYLGKLGIQSVFAEGGAGVHGEIYDNFLKDKKLIDKVIFYMSPKIIGGESALSVIGGRGVEKLEEAKEFGELDIDKIGTDIKIVGIYNKY